MNREVRKRAIIIGPLPPAIGGIATIVGNIKANIGDAAGLSFINSTKSSSKIAAFVHPLAIMWRLFIECLSLKRGKVLMFSSAYFSFWEKCLWSMIVRMTGSYPVMVMVDGNYPSFYRSMPKCLRRLAEYFISHLDLLAVQSEQWRIFYSRIFPNSNIRIVAAGIDTDYYVPSQNKEANELAHILYVGWIMEAKGVLDLLQSIHLLLNGGAKIHVKLIGPLAHDRNCIDDRIESLGLKETLEILPPCRNIDELRNMYQSADIFVFPSHAEGFPLALLEAISSGLPCVATDVGGNRDVLGNGSCGILVPPRRPDELANALGLLIKSDEMRKSFGCEARLRAQTQYTLSECLRSYSSLIGISSTQLHHR